MTNFPLGCRLLWLAVTTVETHFGASESGQWQAQAENGPRVGFLCWVACGDAYHEAWRRQCNCHRAGGYEHWRKRGMLLGCKFVDGHGCVTSARMATTSQPRSLLSMARLNIVQKIIQAYSTSGAVQCAGLAFYGGGGYGWTPRPPYRGIATPPPEACSVPDKASPGKRPLSGRRRQQPPALR